MTSEEYKKKYFESLEICDKIEVQLQEPRKKLAEAARTGTPAFLTESELYRFEAAREAWERFLEIVRHPS